MSSKKNIHFEKFSAKAQHVIQTAMRATTAAQTSVEPTDLLQALALERGSVAGEILQKVSFPKPEEKKGDSAKKELPIATKTKRIMQQAAVMCFNNQHTYIGTEHLLWACLRSNDVGIKNELARHRIAPEKIKEHLDRAITSASKFPDLTKLFQVPTKVDNDTRQAPSRTPALDSFAVDLTGKKEQKKIDPVIGREKEIDFLIEALIRRKKNNPVLIGDAGVGKTAIVEGLAKKIADGDVPHFLRSKRILALDLPLILSGTIYRGEFESRMKQVMDELADDPSTILFIDEIHNLIGAGNATGAMDAANIFKPALARGTLRCIGATTIEEYRKHIEKDPALERRFQPIEVIEPTTEETRDILIGVTKNYETHHNVRIRPDAIEAAVILSERYIPDRHMPDKAIDLIDEASARKRSQQEQTDAEKALDAAIDQLRQAQKDKETAVAKEFFAEAMTLKERVQHLHEKIAKLKKQMRRAYKPLVTAQDIAFCVSRKTNIPAGTIAQEEQKRLLRLEKKLGEHIKGQDEVLGMVADTLRRAHAGVRDPQKPVGSFLFLGPTGVGKTATAKALATALFDDPKAFIQIDMSEFAEGFTTSKLIGAPAGYVGFEQGGKLTNAVRQRPYAVVLFDEVEKAHAEVFNILLQILEEGRLTDASGQKINFKNTVIILTSNAGHEAFSGKGKVGFSENNHSSSFEDQKEYALDQLKKTFKPELIARLETIAVFKKLDESALHEIAVSAIEKLITRLRATGVTVTVDENVAGHLAAISAQQEKGARAILDAIREHIETPLARLLLQHKKGATFSCIMHDTTIVLTAS